MIQTTDVNYYSEQVVVDNEIRNQIADPDPKKDWHYDKAELTVVGILHKGKMWQIILGEDEELFKTEIKGLLDTLPQPFYAFNMNMEKGNFKGYIGKDYNFEEIKPFLGRGWSKDRFYQELVNDGLAQPITDVFGGNAGLCITEWAKGNWQDVASHNSNCLRKEVQILQNQSHLRNKYKDRIKPNGWLD